MVAHGSLRRVALLLVIVLATATAGFAFVDASAVQGEANTGSTVSTAQIDGATASLSDQVTLFVPGDGWLEEAVADRLMARLDDRGADVKLVDPLDGQTGGPVLVVVIKVAEVSYDPVSPTATVKASFAYVQSGNVTLATGLIRDDRPVIANASDAYVAHGDVSVRDRVRGVTTWPAYQRRVATATADEIVGALEDAAGMDQPN